MAIYCTGGIWDKAKNVITDGVPEMAVKASVVSFGNGMARGYCRGRLNLQSSTDGYGKNAHPFRPKFNGSKVL